MNSPAFDALDSFAAKPSSKTRITVSRTIASELVRVLAGAGVTHAFGLIGGAIAPFAHVLGQSQLCFRSMRHESGAAFAACEPWLAPLLGLPA